ncbi:hypothetical protein GW17_00047911 [Ensete ventricosum]|nr:hypothetical protein GW17_00047911 [Ensete ventricosum]
MLRARVLYRPPMTSLKHGEIVYPCIPDSDGEDEGGQASSSLAGVLTVPLLVLVLAVVEALSFPAKGQHHPWSKVGSDSTQRCHLHMGDDDDNRGKGQRLGFSFL